MTGHRNRYRTLVAAFAIVATAGPAVADNSAKSATKSVLPGVNHDYSIVQPVPEPADGLPVAGEDGWYVVGDTKVRITGRITVDIGFGSIKPPRR